MFDALPFLLKTIAIGLIAGLVVGFLSKKVSKLAIFFALLIVVLLQVAAYKGYINIDWLSWKDTAVEVVKNTVKNTEIPTESIKVILLKNVPFSIAAIIGFVFGFIKG
ncbi:MAG: hypothetical protein GY936_19575 [Ignavibacteriae bacterium]|nr:hypothetical protein [Ignavibacteriota bacterium]